MGRIVAIDYGTKRVGIAVTDPCQLIATPLKTVSTSELIHFLQQYATQEEVALFVVGMPRHLNNTPSPMTAIVTKFIKKLQHTFPDVRITPQDERYTSKIAFTGMIAGGFSKQERRDKANLDKLSATIILQSFLVSYRP